MVCDRLHGRNVMRSFIFVAAAIVAVGFTVPAHAAKLGNRTIHRHMDEMKSQDPAGFNACQSLASTRGYRIGMTGEYENKALMEFHLGLSDGSPTLNRRALVELVQD